MGRFSLTVFLVTGFLLSIQSLSGSYVYAQQVLGFHLSEANGLHTNYNFEIYQDSDGYMWFGGDNGIARYDGESFRYFTVDEGLPGNYTYSIIEDRNGTIWAGGYGGWLAKKEGDHFETVVSEKETELNSVLDLSEDEKGNLMIKGSNGFLYLNPNKETFSSFDLHTSLKGASFIHRRNGNTLVFDKEHLHKIKHVTEDSLELEPVPITFSSNIKNRKLPAYSNSTLLETRNGIVYLVANGVTFEGIWKGDSLELQKKYFHPISNHAVFNHDTTGIFLGSIRNGLVELDLKTGKYESIHLLAQEEPFRVFRLYTDYENNVWVSAFSHGVFKLGENRITQYSTRNGLLSNTVNHISTFKDAYLLTHERNLSFINKKDYSYQYNYRNSYENRFTVPDDDGDEFYVGANYYISKVKTGKKDWNEAVSILYTIDTTPSSVIDFGDSLLITTIGNSVLKYQNGIVTVMKGEMWKPLSIVEQAFVTDDEIWFVTQSNGIYVFHREEKKMRKLSGIPTEMISYAAKNGERAWLGSRKGIMELKNDSLLNIHGVEAGLTGRKIYHIADQGKAIWVVSDLGIHRFRSQKWVLVQSFSDLFNRPPQINHGIVDPEYNRLLLGTNEGLITIPLDTEVSPKTIPRITVESLSFGDKQRFEKPGRLKPDSVTSYQRSVQINYKVLSFTNSNEASYFYRLLPIQPEWKNEQGKQSVLFANLAPDSYRFQVKQVFPDGTETEVAETYFFILPFFYETLFFRLVMSALGLCVIGLAIRFAVVRKEQKRRRREENKQFEMIQRVGASIAHDIKNTVFSLSLLAQNLEKRFDNPAFRKDAIETINDSLSHLSRLVSQLKQRPRDWHINRNRSDLAKTVSSVVYNLAGEKHAERRIEFHNNLPESTLFHHDYDLIRRIIENLLINAIEVTDSDEKITISLTEKDDDIHLVISDEGPGMTQRFIKHKLFRPFETTKKQGVGIGMYVTREMIKAHKGELKITSKRGEGTTMDIRFPK